MEIAIRTKKNPNNTTAYYAYQTGTGGRMCSTGIKVPKSPSARSFAHKKAEKWLANNKKKLIEKWAAMPPTSLQLKEDVKVDSDKEQTELLEITNDAMAPEDRGQVDSKLKLRCAIEYIQGVKPEMISQRYNVPKIYISRWSKELQARGHLVYGQMGMNELKSGGDENSLLKYKDDQLNKVKHAYRQLLLEMKGNELGVAL